MRSTAVLLVASLLLMSVASAGGPQIPRPGTEKALASADKPTAMAGKSSPEVEPGRKGKFPWLLVGGAIVLGAAVGALVAVLVLGKKDAAPQEGAISVTSTPAGAKVYLDGADTGAVTDCVIGKVKAGNHALRIDLANYGKWEGTVTVVTGQTVNVAASLSPFTYEFLAKWGGAGGGDGQFNDATGIAVDAAGSVYVADMRNARIQKFDANGGFIRKWGSSGSGDGQFNGLRKLAVDSSGFLYAADAGNHRIQKFTTDGAFVTRWGSYGTGYGQFNYPWGVAVDNAGFVYVADSSNNRIQKFTTGGTFVQSWGAQGSSDGQLYGPAGIAVDPAAGYVYVADTGNYRIVKYNTNGGFLAKWGGQGTGDGQFNGATAVAVDPFGYVFVVDYIAYRIQKFDANGAFLTKWGSRGAGDGQFDVASSLAADSAGRIFTAEYATNQRVQKFGLTDRVTLNVEITYSPLGTTRKGAPRPGLIGGEIRPGGSRIR